MGEVDPEVQYFGEAIKRVARLVQENSMPRIEEGKELPSTVFDETEWGKTVSIRFNNGVLEQKWCTLGKFYQEVWRPVPKVENPPEVELVYSPPIGSYLTDVVQFEGPARAYFESGEGMCCQRYLYNVHATHAGDRQIALWSLYNEVKDSLGEVSKVVWWRHRPEVVFLAERGIWRATARWVCTPPGVFPNPEPPPVDVKVEVAGGQYVRFTTSADPDRHSPRNGVELVEPTEEERRRGY